MPAIITSNFRLKATESFLDDLQSATNKHYLGIGRAHAWPTVGTPDTPYENDSTVNTCWESLYAAKKIDAADSIYATKRKLWVSGTTYVEYDDQDTDLESKDYFVITDNNNVMLCLKAGPSGSTTDPDVAGVTTSGIIDNSGSDGYQWKYMYTVSTGDSTKFLTSSFVPVKRITSDPGSGADSAYVNQWSVQDNAIDGAIYNIKVTAGGTGYTSVPTVTITGNGSSCAATAVLTSQVLTGITVTNAGTGYDNAVVTITGGGGSNATARAVIGPEGGFGKDARNELRAHYIAINKTFNGDESSAISDGNDFRQIALIENPIDDSTSAVAAGSIYRTEASLTVATGGSFAVDAEIQGSVSGAKGIVVEYDSTNGIIYYNQNADTGYGVFDSSTPDLIRLSSAGSGGQTLSAKAVPDLDKYSGEILFLENRTAVSRGSDQIETIRLVIAF
tara:strand:- start:256 stop:1596 length:1341 start_codon:yes stop_codon:yes gene_type:complete